MANLQFIIYAVALMLLVIVIELLKRYTKFNMDNIDVTKLIEIKKVEDVNFQAINRNTGERSLVLVDAGINKITVLATLRQITGLGLKEAKHIIDKTPNTFITNISDEEADMTKKALEFVGAKIDIV